MNEKYIQKLRDAILQQHHCSARYASTATVKEEAADPLPAWEGYVELFDLAGHPQARQCYAWGVKDEDGRWQYVTILNPPAKSPAEAVRHYLQQQAGKTPPL